MVRKAVREAEVRVEAHAQTQLEAVWTAREAALKTDLERTRDELTGSNVALEMARRIGEMKL